MRVSLAVLAVVLLVTLLPAQNSTRKLRREPGEVAGRVGSAVPWAETVQAALASSKESGKPVFWYVPSVAGSPMDRKPEIDRYLRGGPFSWPSTIALLQTRFVCVDEVPRGELQARFGLRRNEFIEPGYLVLDATGKVLAKVDQITTLHPQWFEAPLRRLVGAPDEGFPGAPGLREAWQAYRDLDAEAAIAAAEKVLQQAPSAELSAEAQWLIGAALCRSGRRGEAVTRWQQLAAALPDEPLAQKAALEAEGHGPFVHAFEDFLPLPAGALQRDPVDGTRCPGVYDEAQLWQRSVSFLLRAVDDDGVYRDSQYDFGGTDSLPNVYAAVTCLAGMALLTADQRARDGALVLSAPQRERLGALLDKIRANAESEAWLALSDRDEILWSRAYALRFLAAWRAQRPGDAEALKPALQNAVGALLALQPDTGVWFHEYGNPFAIATALQALHEAKVAGVDVDQDKIDRGLRALAQNRTAQGAFTYSHTRRGQPRASIDGAAGRMPLCELALQLFGASDQDRLAAAVGAGFEHHGLLAAVRKYDDHASSLGYGGFFFWFDMLGRVEATLQLQDAADRKARLAAMRGLVLDLPEFDGCFVDSHELGRVYGTSMALLCLSRCAR
ncbi:MAG: hypothetical protein H6838_05965 [Planctomycetes bacterium]|nr:hypothetical protein [Planctomycetota bacterium]